MEKSNSLLGADLHSKSDSARTRILSILNKADNQAGKEERPEVLAPRPPVASDAEGVVEHFVMQATSQSATVERVPDKAAALLSVARYVQTITESWTGGNHKSSRAAHQLVVTPELADWDWSSQASLDCRFGEAHDKDSVGVTGAFCAVADTGTLVLCSSKDAPSDVSLLPETHIAILKTNRLVAYMEDAWALLEKEWGSMPRAVNFVSGPSRTGDIEQTIVLGAHGPCRVHIILIDE